MRNKFSLKERSEMQGSLSSKYDCKLLGINSNQVATENQILNDDV